MTQNQATGDILVVSLASQRDLTNRKLLACQKEKAEASSNIISLKLMIMVCSLGSAHLKKQDAGDVQEASFARWLEFICWKLACGLPRQGSTSIQQHEKPPAHLISQQDTRYWLAVGQRNLGVQVVLPLLHCLKGRCPSHIEDDEGPNSFLVIDLHHRGGNENNSIMNAGAMTTGNIDGCFQRKLSISRVSSITGFFPFQDNVLPSKVAVDKYDEALHQVQISHGHREQESKSSKNEMRRYSTTVSLVTVCRQ